MEHEISADLLKTGNPGTCPGRGVPSKLNVIRAEYLDLLKNTQAGRPLIEITYHRRPGFSVGCSFGEGIAGIGTAEIIACACTDNQVGCNVRPCAIVITECELFYCITNIANCGRPVSKQVSAITTCCKTTWVTEGKDGHAVLSAGCVSIPCSQLAAQVIKIPGVERGYVIAG